MATVAGIVSITVYVLGLTIALLGGFPGRYIAAPTVNLAFGTVFIGLVVFQWGARYHHQVWETAGAAFDVPQEEYRDVIEPGLHEVYSIRRLATAYIVALVFLVIIDLRIGLEMAIVVPGWRDVHLHMAAINYLYGILVLFLVVAGIHGAAHFVLLSAQLRELPLADIGAAADQLAPIAQFSAFAGTTFIGGVILLTVAYQHLLAMWWIDAHAGVMGAILAALILVGVAVFALPQTVIHRLLYRAKHDHIVALNTEYTALLERCRAEDGTPGFLQAELEVIDAKRRNAKEIRTWSYDLPEIVPLAGSALVSGVLLLEQLIQLGVLG